MTVVHDKGLKRDIGKTGLLFTGVGSIIGSGWLFGAFDAASMAGPAAILSWAIGAILIIFVALNYSELGVMFPVAGGVVRYPHYAFGSFASYTSGWITWLSAAGTFGIEVLAAVQYASSYMPWLMESKEGVLVLTVPGIFVSIAMVAVFCVINMFGVKFFAQFNNVLVWWKLAVILLVIVVFFALAFNPGHFTSQQFGGFAPNGVAPILAALPAAGIVFSYLGFRKGVEFAGETKNPQRNVPFAVIGSIVLTGIIYILLQVAFIGAIPPWLLKSDDNPDGGLDMETARGMQTSFRADREAFLDGFLTTFFSVDGELVVTEEQRQRALELAAQANGDAAAACIVLWTSRFTDDVARLSVPTLIVHGDSDAIVPFEVSGKRLHEQVAGSELVVVEGGPHGLLASHTDLVNRTLLEFLAR